MKIWQEKRGVLNERGARGGGAGESYGRGGGGGETTGGGVMSTVLW